MKKINLIFLLFAVFAAGSMMCIGIAIAERSIIGIFLSTLALIIVFGIGFSFKSKSLRNR